MTGRISVTFEEGVLVPREKLEYPEHQAFTVTLDVRFPDDPPPEEGVELLDWFSRHRIKLDAKKAARSQRIRNTTVGMAEQCLARRREKIL